MSRSEKISERLPHFYKCWEPKSSINNLIASLGKRLDESEKELISIMYAHWVDTASGDDLDKLGALYNIKRKDNESDPDYRNRWAKTAIISYKGGGTVSAIEMLVRLTLKLFDNYPVNIVENPPISMKETWNVRTGDEWEVDSRSVRDTLPDITIKVETGKITDPTIENLITKESITFKGDISSGDILTIKNGQALLNDADHTDRLSTINMPKLQLKRMYLFDWDKIPGDETEMLKDFLKENYGIDWVESATIEKISRNTMKIYSEKNSLSLNLNTDKNEVNLKIDDVRRDVFDVKTGNRIFKKTKWKYTIEVKMGRFDRSQFDESRFSTETLSAVTFEWTANQPAAFEVHIPKELIDKAGVTADHMQDIVNSGKACGVKAVVKVI